MKKSGHLRIDFLSYIKYNVFVGGIIVMKMGRPKTEKAKRKSVTIRLTESSHTKLKNYAAEHKMTYTEVITKSLEEFFQR